MCPRVDTGPVQGQNENEINIKQLKQCKYAKTTKLGKIRMKRRKTTKKKSIKELVKNSTQPLPIKSSVLSFEKL